MADSQPRGGDIAMDDLDNAQPPHYHRDNLSHDRPPTYAVDGAPCVLPPRVQQCLRIAQYTMLASIMPGSAALIYGLILRLNLDNPRWKNECHQFIDYDHFIGNDKTMSRERDFEHACRELLRVGYTLIAAAILTLFRVLLQVLPTRKPRTNDNFSFFSNIYAVLSFYSAATFALFIYAVVAVGMTPIISGPSNTIKAKFSACIALLCFGIIFGACQAVTYALVSRYYRQLSKSKDIGSTGSE